MAWGLAGTGREKRTEKKREREKEREFEKKYSQRERVRATSVDGNQLPGNRNPANRSGQCGSQAGQVWRGSPEAALAAGAALGRCWRLPSPPFPPPLSGALQAWPLTALLGWEREKGCFRENWGTQSATEKAPCSAPDSCFPTALQQTQAGQGSVCSRRCWASYRMKPGRVFHISEN